MDLQGQAEKIQEWQRDTGATDEDVIAALSFLRNRRTKWDSATGPPVEFRQWALTPGYRLSQRHLDLFEMRKSEHPGGLYPVVLEELCDINSGDYVELVCTGGIGSAKTTVVIETLLYQLYSLMCLRSPQLEYELDPSDEIEIVFQSLNKQKAKEVGYDRFKNRVQRSPWFRSYAPHNSQVTSQLELPKRVIVKPVIAAATGAMGENVIGGLIDETEFQAITKDSKRASDPSGTYNQARENYTALVNRRQSRFQSAGNNLAGLVCLVSSANRRAGFIEERAAAAKEDPTIRVYRHTTWSIAPWRYGRERFEVFVGDESRTPFTVGDRGREPTGKDRKLGLVIEVPVELKKSFKQDLPKALRDLAGVGTDALLPFITDKESLLACFNRTESILSLPACDFVHTTPKIELEFLRNPEEPRFVHVDLAATQDCAGVTIGHVEGFRRVHRGAHHLVRGADGTEYEQQEWEMLPVVVIDCILQVIPPPGGEIPFSAIRELLYRLKAHGVPITWVTADKFQSRDFLQEMRRKGYRVGLSSMDESTWGYEVSKTAFYDGRVEAPYHETCQNEFIRLEKDLSNPKRPKVDHPPDGSKDCSDSTAGVIAGLSRRIEVWLRHGLRPRDIPYTIAMRPKRDGGDSEPPKSTPEKLW
jgi:hypothetical protein